MEKTNVFQLVADSRMFIKAGDWMEILADHWMGRITKGRERLARR